jgi:hypothetical protein
MGCYFDLLYSRPSFFEGAASIMDIGGTLVEYNSSPSADEADVNAIRAAWRQVGEDMEAAINAVAAETGVATVKRGRRR